MTPNHDRDLGHWKEMHDHVMHARQPQATRAHGEKSCMEHQCMASRCHARSRPKWLMHMHIKLPVSRLITCCFLALTSPWIFWTVSAVSFVRRWKVA